MPFLAPNFRRFDSFLAPNFRRLAPFLAPNFSKPASLRLIISILVHVYITDLSKSKNKQHYWQKMAALLAAKSPTQS